MFYQIPFCLQTASWDCPQPIGHINVAQLHWNIRQMLTYSHLQWMILSKLILHGYLFFIWLINSVLYKFQNWIIAIQPRLLNILLEWTLSLLNHKNLDICNGTKKNLPTFHKDKCFQQNLALLWSHMFCVCHSFMHWKPQVLLKI